MSAAQGDQTLALSEQEPAGFIIQLQPYNISCYWNRNETSPSPVYAFHPMLQLASPSFLPAARFAYSPTFNNQFLDTDVFRDIFTKLHEDHVKLTQSRVSQYLCGSESDSPYYPLVLPPGTTFTPEGVLTRLGAHTELVQRVNRYNFEVRPEEGERMRMHAFVDGRFHPENQEFLRGGERERVAAERQQGVDIWDRVKGEAPWPLVFYAGSDRLNPVPFFILGQLGPGLVGGFMSVVYHT